MERSIRAQAADQDQMLMMTLETGRKFFGERFWGSTFLALCVASGFVGGKRGRSDGICHAAAS